VKEKAVSLQKGDGFSFGAQMTDTNDRDLRSIFFSA
jgi:hypothetical protein